MMTIINMLNGRVVASPNVYQLQRSMPCTGPQDDKISAAVDFRMYCIPRRSESMYHCLNISFITMHRGQKDIDVQQ